MQRTLEDVGRIDTDQGTVHLRMSVGMHLGPIDFALLGDRQLTILALGPHATRCCQLEKQANSGETLVSRELADTLDRRSVRARVDGALTLRRRLGDAAQPASSRRRIATATCASMLIPVPLRTTLGEDVPGEHRPSRSALFESVISTPWSAALGLPVTRFA